MFADAIELVGSYTRPIKIISRNYRDPIVIPATASMFFVNEDGYAVTCKHVVEELIRAEQLNANYAKFKSARGQLTDNNKKNSILRALEKQFNLGPKTTAEMKVQFRDCVDFFTNIDMHLSARHDIAVLHFKGFGATHYKGHAVLAKESGRIRPGDMLCRLGYPFPEFSDFTYDAASDEIRWTSSGSSDTPRFPIDGMFTRHLGDASGNIVGIEISTPGLRGQSGGPLFSSDGIVYGVQSKTQHLHLGFDMKNEKITVNGKEETFNNQPFLHVGHCVHVDILKEFLDELHIKYYVGDSIDKAEAVNG